MIRDLSELQGVVKDLMEEGPNDLPGSPEWLAANTGHDQDSVIGVVLTRMEMVSPSRDPEVIDVIWAGEFLDHLDTLGFKVVRG